MAMSDLWVIVMCGLYVSAEALLAYLGHKYLSIKGEGIRKFIHITTSFLVFPLLYAIDNPALRYFGPIFFILFNAIATYSGMGRIIGMNDEKRHIGLVIYPLSVLILVFLYNSGFINIYSAFSGVLVMGLGDGMAALLGTKLGRHKYKVPHVGGKSIEGTFAMFAFSFLVVFVLTPLGLWKSLVVALFSAFVENVSPSGVDNLSVPLLSAFVMEALWRL